MSAHGSEKIILGSRGSELARRQTSLVEAALRQAWPGLEIATQIISTRGDDREAEPINRRAGRKGLFTAEIERALSAGEIDIAVHSAKDLPSETTPGLELRVLPRAAVEDVLIRKTAGGLASLRPNAIVATGSVRRWHQLQRQCPDLEVIELRGNVPTRLHKLVTNDWDAIVLARAGLDRLGYDLVSGRFDFEGTPLFAEILSRDEFVPAGGQGVIAMQLRSDDEKAKAIADQVSDANTLLCLRAEREFLRLLQGDCDSPVGVLATIENDAMTLSAQVFEPEKDAPKSAKVWRVPLMTAKPETVAELLRNFMYAAKP